MYDDTIGFEQNEEPTYDVAVPDQPIYDDVGEEQITKKPDEPVYDTANEPQVCLLEMGHFPAK